jgi:uncharacterized protein
MAHIDVLDPAVGVEGATLVEGFPGVGLVGKIAADHLADQLGTVHYANVHCERLPPVATYGADETALRTAVRLYVAPEAGLVALRSDVPVGPEAAAAVADCLADWYDEHGITPVYLSGLPAEKDDEPPAVDGVAAGDGDALLADAGIDEPAESGLISGPTGALLLDAVERERTAVGLVVESDPSFPDPEAARAVLSRGVGPLTGVDVPTDDLVERAEEIRAARERLAKRMEAEGADATSARPLRMYQ